MIYPRFWFDLCKLFHVKWKVIEFTTNWLQKEESNNRNTLQASYYNRNYLQQLRKINVFHFPNVSAVGSHDNARNMQMIHPIAYIGFSRVYKWNLFLFENLIYTLCALRWWKLWFLVGGLTWWGELWSGLPPSYLYIILLRRYFIITRI